MIFISACADPVPRDAPDPEYDPHDDPGTSGVDGTSGSSGVVPEEFRCDTAASAEPIPMRSQVIEGTSTSHGRRVFTSDLYNLFRAYCGGCHVDARLGGFQVAADTFPRLVTSQVLERIELDDADRVMPPVSAGGVPFSQRGESDPVRELAATLRLWIAAGSPPDFFCCR